MHKYTTVAPAGQHILPAGIATLKNRTRMTPQEALTAGKTGKADLHMHSTYSDGIATIEQILDYTQRQTDLNVIAITDHDEIEGALRARDLWARGNYRFDLVVGEEVSTSEGHLLALFIERLIPPGLSMERSIDLIHEQEGLAVIAHPLHPFFRESCSQAVMDRIHAARDVWFDGIETWNASFCGLSSNPASTRANRAIYALPEVGNSDAHSLVSIARGFTWFPGTSARDMRRAIEQGLSAPGGSMWSIRSYYDWIYGATRQRKQAAQRQPALAT
ncbi:MAG: phosphotransferase [Ktedonobacteraceae bacterium]|nr:phosphotransferase [Ktedonobacteraceae bacterium]